MNTPPHREGAVRLGPGAEFDLIRKLVGATSGLSDEVRVGPGDDCAVLAGGAVIGVDLTVEGVHFRDGWLTPTEIGYRATTAALSDLAAVAAVPVGVLVAIAVSGARLRDETVPELQRGVDKAARESGAVVLGGDLSRSPGPIVVSITVVGRSAAPVLRSGAVPGDEVWVTGRLGGAARAVRGLESGATLPDAVRSAYARPRARIAEALWLAEREVPRAMIDLSDGLAGDAQHLAAASEVGIVLEAERIPLPEAVSGDPAEGGVKDESVTAPTESLRLALEGGEDYELLFAARPDQMDPLAQEFEAHFGAPLTRVGRVVEGSGVLLDRGAGPPQPVGRGFDHLRGTDGP